MVKFAMRTVLIIKPGVGSLTMSCFGLSNQVSRVGPVSIRTHPGAPEPSVQCFLETGTWGPAQMLAPAAAVVVMKSFASESVVTCALPCPWHCGRLLW